MRRDDRDDPFDDLFREIERMMNEMMGEDFDMHVERGGGAGGQTGFGTETHVDIHESDDTVRVIADLPGVEKEDIDLKCDGEVLTISAGSDHRQYDERVSLPAQVDEHSASATYNNGVLEVQLEKAEDSADIDVQ
ncbi:Hsp20/alpha crystallin family protein [Halorussus limi]|uniref:Hsp20/alpha crystallin family protein n=1 Tax=Halorussus limi TaxID=2938695 RepID=A0A8U0HZ15_9EURY|nr:Hsp20/alpha crystallin family protein [Halorussus limi]UPV76168.1 Hsp20/alpha crystallin family protein [Halorussus limi]